MPIAAALVTILQVGPAHAGTDAWTGASNGFWEVAGNWSNGLPASGDTIVLGANNTTFRPFDTTLAVGAVSGTGTLTVGNSGTLRIGQASSIGGLATAASGTVGMTTLNVGALQLGGGSLGVYSQAAGVVNVSGLATFDAVYNQVNNTALNLNGGATWANGAATLQLLISAARSARKTPTATCRTCA